MSLVHPLTPTLKLCPIEAKGSEEGTMAPSGGTVEVQAVGSPGAVLEVLNAKESDGGQHWIGAKKLRHLLLER